MHKNTLSQAIKEKSSFLCVGLDTDVLKLPAHLPPTPEAALEFNREIILHTKAYAVAYKLNIAFYESMGSKGWDVMEKTLEYIPEGIMTIADAKRGDIGNSSRMYARTFFETYQFDAITVAPYMGRDSVAPFLEFENKWVFLLGLTSNEGAQDFQYMRVEGQTLYERVISESQKWAQSLPGNLGYVVGATRVEQIEDIRKICPDAFFLVPGVGAQGGDLEGVCKYGMNKDGGLLINSSRGIIYRSNENDFGVQSGQAAKTLADQMKEFVKSNL